MATRAAWKALAAALEEGAAPWLKRLDLRRNKIGDEGCEALAAAFKEGAAPRLETLLELYSNQIGDEGCKALAAALGKEGAAPRLEKLYLNENKLSDEGGKALAAALKEGAAPSLKARHAPPSPLAPPPPNAHSSSPRVQTLVVGNKEHPELMAVCEERGIKLC